MIFPRSLVRTAAMPAGFALGLLVASLACAQGLAYQGQQGETAGSSVQEQMPPALEHPKTNSVTRAKAKPKAAAPSHAPQPTQSAAEAANAAAQCTRREDVLGTSRTIH